MAAIARKVKISALNHVTNTDIWTNENTNWRVIYGNDYF